MRHAAARLAVTVLAATMVAVPVLSCAHFNSPGEVYQCMKNSEDQKAAEQLVFAMVDKDAVAALESALVLAPDLVKCMLRKAASFRGAGGVAGERAKKAQQFLDSHGLSDLMRCGEEESRLAHNQEVTGSNPVGATTWWDSPGGRVSAFVSGPYVTIELVSSDGHFQQANLDEGSTVEMIGALTTLLDARDLPSPGIGPGSGGR